MPKRMNETGPYWIALRALQRRILDSTFARPDVCTFTDAGHKLALDASFVARLLAKLNAQRTPSDPIVSPPPRHKRSQCQTGRCRSGQTGPR